jgi:hypothetical protein
VLDALAALLPPARKEATMKKTKLQNEEPILVKTRRNSSKKGESMNIIRIDVQGNWKKLFDMYGTSYANDDDADCQLMDIAAALQQEGFTILLCHYRCDFHLILPEDQEGEACDMINKALRTSCKLHKHVSLIKYKRVLYIQQHSPICHDERCELSALYMPELKNRLVSLVERNNKKRAGLLKPNTHRPAPTANISCEHY